MKLALNLLQRSADDHHNAVRNQYYAEGKMKTARIVICLAILWASHPALRASDASQSVVGTYANLSYNMDGAGGQNRLMPRLEIRADGTYRWGRESGTYKFREGKINFSGPYASWDPGRVDKDRKIWFEFTKSGKHFTVTMYHVVDK